MKTTISTNSSHETAALGERLGKLLRPGDVVALFGDLGAGKTILTKGIAAGMRLEADIHSPSFTLIHEHPGEPPLYHVDLYRLSGEAEVQGIGIEEYIHRDGVTVIEWADRMKPMLPDERLDVDLRMKGSDHRELVFETDSLRLWSVIGELARDADNCD